MNERKMNERGINGRRMNFIKTKENGQQKGNKNT